MRVIGGSCRGRPLRAPAGAGTRPTSDRVREAIFDILGSLTDLEGAEVVDLFAGSGALGIEALSRGAAAATFVEQHREALESIRSNLAATGFTGSATVVRADAVGWLDGAGRDRRFDVALVDPPYAFDAWPALLGRLPAALAVLESAAPPVLPAGWETARQKRYGGTLVTVVRPGQARPQQKGSA